MSTYPYNNPIPTFPLSVSPYNSRVTFSEIVSSPSKNYPLVAFRPGFPLQASELNEIQETLLLNQTLTNFMYGSWTTQMSGETNYSLPGWKGSIPLWPKKMEIPNEDPSYNMFYYENVSGAQSNTLTPAETALVTITAKAGWYYVYNKKIGMKSWVYLSQDLVSNPINVGPNNSYIGFATRHSFVNASADGSLYDNSSLNDSSSSPAGASRMKITIQQLFVSSNPNLTDIQISPHFYDFSPIAKISDSLVGTVQYMNNRIVPQGS